MPFRFAVPGALLFLLLVPVLIIIARRSLAGLGPFRQRASFAVRAAVLGLLILALAGMQWVKRGEDLTVLFLLDQSQSVPPGSRREAIAYVNDAVKQAGKHDRAGLILFGGDAGLERFPEPIVSGKRWFAEPSVVIDREHTNLEGAIRLALAAFPEGSRKRIVLLSDGCENRGLALGQADIARSLNCPVDVMMIDYEHHNEVLIDKALAPPRLRVGEPFELRVVVKALQDCPAEINLSIDGQPFETGRKISLQKGKEVVSFSFPEGLSQPGPYTFEATILSPGSDTILANNSAVAYSWVEGKARKVLLIDSNPQDLSFLADALAAEDIDAAVSGPEGLPASIAELRRYDCLVLSNVGAYRLSAEQLGMIESAVKELGMGLLLVGGEESFGAGGYRDTPIEDCSPVDFDIRQKRVMPKGAIVLVLDAAEDANANRWAIEMAQSAVKVLSYHDEVGIIAGGQWHTRLREVGDKQDLLAAIDKMQVWDNDAFETLLGMCLAELRNSDAASKHALIMTDGGHVGYAPSKKLQGDLQEARVSVTVAVFRPHPGTEKKVVTSLKRLADYNRGRFYYPRNASELPRIFFKEATMISRSLIHEQPFQPVLRQATDPIHGFDGFPTLKGYVLTTPKARAQVPLVRSYHDKKLNEKVNDPILAHWNYGLGKVVAFTADAKNRWGAEWVGWPGYRKFWPQLVRWALPAAATGSATVRSNIAIRDDTAHLSTDVLDARGLPINFLELEGSVLTPRADTFGRFESTPLRLQQTGPGCYETEFPAGDPGAYFVSLSYNGTDSDGEDLSGVHTTAAAVPYSPEYRDLAANTPLLKKIAENSGGRVLPYGTSVFERTMPAAASSQPIWPLLLLLAVVTFPADVALRKIAVDWRRVAAAVAGWLTALRPEPKPKLQVDTGMGRLLSRKQKTRQVLSGGRPSTLPPAGDQDAPDAAPSSAAFAGPESAREAEAKPAGPAEPGVNTYTRRLIQAKKRARGKNE